jgi:uncharacterized membrane protein YfcA
MGISSSLHSPGIQHPHTFALSMTLDQILSVALVILLGSALQSGVGFGFDLLALPVLVLLGLDLPGALMILLITSTAQVLLTVHQLRHAVNWCELTPVILISLVALPAGIYLLRQLTFTGPATIRQVVGALVLIAVAVRIFVNPRPREHTSKLGGLIAGFLGGLFGGLAGISGPPVIVWIHAHNWDNTKARVSYLAFLIPSIPVRFALMLWTFPVAAKTVLPVAAALIPVSLAGAWIGLQLGHKIPSDHLRRLAYGLLLALGVICLTVKL